MRDEGGDGHEDGYSEEVPAAEAEGGEASEKLARMRLNFQSLQEQMVARREAVPIPPFQL